jgi:hypothetical protein
VIRIEQDAGGSWTAKLQMEENGPAVAFSDTKLTRRDDAWDAAFELYRQHVVI